MHLVPLFALGAPCISASPAVPQETPQPIPTLTVDRFAHIRNGQNLGWQILSLQQTDSGYRYREDDYFRRWRRSVDVQLDANFVPIAFSTKADGPGPVVSSEIGLVGQRAVGFYKHRGPFSLEIPVDTVLPDGAVPAVALWALVRTLEWESGRHHTLTLFDVEGMTITDHTLAISGIEMVEVPAGVFEAFRADLTTTEGLVALWVTREPPHRILKIVGPTIETVLVHHSPTRDPDG